MNCGEFQDALSRYLDREMDAGERAAFVAHGEACRECRETLEAHERLETLMGDIPMASRAVVPLRSPRVPRRAASLAALRACAAVLAVVAVFLLGRGTLPQDGGPATSPAARVARDRGREVREVRLGDSTYRVTVEGEATQLLACRVEEGPGRSAEVDCIRDSEPASNPSGGVKR